VVAVFEVFLDVAGSAEQFAFVDCGGASVGPVFEVVRVIVLL